MKKNCNPKLCVHHIGGRAGTQAFPHPARFEQDIINVLYDADVDCVPQIKNTSGGKGSPTYVLPYCLADTCKTSQLNINYDPYTSSLFEFNPDYGSCYAYSSHFDCLLSENINVQEKRTINTVSLDYILGKDQIPAPNFLSIDTQGAEYDILLGAKETLKSHVVAVALEAMFHPLYKGQKLFGDICQLLNSQGFHFVRFLNINEVSSFRGPIGFRGHGLHVESDALFLRRCDYPVSSHSEENYDMLRKLAFIAIVYNQFEYALDCLQRSRALAPVKRADEELQYLKFLDQFEAIYEKTDKVFPLTFTHFYPSFELSKARFRSEAAGENKRKNVKQVLQSRAPLLYGVLKKGKGLLRKASGKTTNFVKHRLGSYNTIEKFFLEYGLKSQADILREYRISQSDAVTINRNGKLK